MKTPTIATGRFCRAIASVWLVGVALLTACASIGGEGEKAPDYMVVEGRARVDPATFADGLAWALAFSGPLKATVQTPLDATIPDSSQRVLAAQAAARRASQRALCERILALPDATQTPLSRRLENRPELAAALNKLIADRSRVEVAAAEQQVKCEAVIDGPIVLELFRRHDVPFQVRLSDLGVSRQEMVKNEAYRLAVEDLRGRLREQIMEIKDADGNALSRAFQSHPERERDLDAMLLLMVQANSINYEEDGTCRVECYFDANKAREIARGKSPTW
jgi:hypothetical protein